MSTLNHEWFPHKWEYVYPSEISHQIYCTVCGLQTQNSFVAAEQVEKENPMCFPLVEIIENV